MSEEEITIRAKIILYSTENGGRENPIHTGYRPNHVFEYKKNPMGFLLTYIGEIDFGYEYIQPGESAIGIVRFLANDSLKKYIQKGRVWGLNEGIRKVGEAEILEILDKN